MDPNHNNNSWCDSRTVLKNWLLFSQLDLLFCLLNSCMKWTEHAPSLGVFVSAILSREKTAVCCAPRTRSPREPHTSDFNSGNELSCRKTTLQIPKSGNKHMKSTNNPRKSNNNSIFTVHRFHSFRYSFSSAFGGQKTHALSPSLCVCVCVTVLMVLLRRVYFRSKSYTASVCLPTKSIIKLSMAQTFNKCFGIISLNWHESFTHYSFNSFISLSASHWSI